MDIKFRRGLIIALLTVGFFNQSFSQGPPEFGIYAGPQMTWASYRVDGLQQETTSKYGFHVGALLKVPFDNQLFFSPNIYYSLKGYKVDLVDRAFPPSTTAKNNDVTFHSVELAGLLQYDFSKTPGGLFIKAGPAFHVIVSGNEKFTLDDETVVDQPMKFSFGDYGRITASINTQLGYETAGRMMIFAFYNHGWGSMNNADGGPKIKNRVVGITLGKYLGKN